MNVIEAMQSAVAALDPHDYHDIITNLRPAPRNEQGVMKMENAQTENSAAGGASALTAGLGGEELAWQQQARQQNAFEFFAAVIFGMDITRLGAVYLEGTTLSAWEAWQEAEENETMPALGPERETLKELARLSIENMRLKQTMPNV